MRVNVIDHSLLDKFNYSHAFNTVFVNSLIYTIPNSPYNLYVYTAIGRAYKALFYGFLLLTLIIRSFACIVPLIEFNQIIEVLNSINFKVPSVTRQLYSKINIASSLNLNFTFTTPFNWMGIQNLFPNATIDYQRLGYNKSSFLFNIQHQIVSAFYIFIAVMIIKGIVKRVSAAGHGFITSKIISQLKEIESSKSSIFHELYYQERMYMYFSLFHFVKSLDITKRIWFDVIASVAMIYIDVVMQREWFDFYSTDIEGQSYSLQKQFQLEKTEWKYRNFLSLLVFFQIYFSLVINLLSNNWLQICMVFPMFLGLALYIPIRVGYSHQKKQLVNYTIVYSVLTIYSVVWLWSSQLVNNKFINICGWVNTSLLLLPSISTMVLYVPTGASKILKEIKEWIKRIVAAARKRKHSLNIIK